MSRQKQDPKPREFWEPSPQANRTRHWITSEVESRWHPVGSPLLWRACHEGQRPDPLRLSSGVLTAIRDQPSAEQHSHRSGRLRLELITDHKARLPPPHLPLPKMILHQVPLRTWQGEFHCSNLKPWNHFLPLYAPITHIQSTANL